MLNLGNLLTSMMLATGVATTTPVSHAENIINDYELTLNPSEPTRYTYILENHDTGNQDTEGKYVNGRDIKVNYSHDTTNYINVLGSKYVYRAWQYITGNTDVESNKIYLFQNMLTLNGSDNYHRYACTNLIILQIDAYNYNLNTEMSLTLALNLDDANDVNNTGANYWLQGKNYERLIYHTTKNDWSQYINKQLVWNTPKTIKDEIENVNNNFYYTKRADTIGMTENTKTDTFEIGLEPNKRNYIAVFYTPIVYAERYYNGQYAGDDTDDIIPLKAINQDLGTPTISGTNVIPDTTYEVIDIPGLMWEILTMPFAFVSQAFNLTLFPGTPYQVNISNLFLSIIAIIVFIWLITFFLKMKG